jgi:hypothetical protein
MFISDQSETLPKMAWNQLVRKLVSLGVILTATVCSAMSARAQVSGQWAFSVSTPAGADDAVFELEESEGKIEGYYSGILGAKKPVKGTYKESKISLSFQGEWPGDGSTVEVKATGELSDDSGSGAVVVVDRTEGSWTAKRVKQEEQSKPDKTDPAETGVADAEQWNRFEGEWIVGAGAAKIVEDAVRQATHSMGSIARGVARGRLMKGHTPPGSIRMRRQGESFTIAFEGSSEQTYPISGAEVKEEDLRRWLKLENAILHQIGERTDGKRENVYRIGDKPDTMIMDVTVTSPRLPAPVRYTLELTRTRPPSPTAPSAPSTLPRQSKSERRNIGTR